MTFLPRRLLAACAALLFLAVPAAWATTPSQPWPHLASDLPVDPSVRFGTLPNGMRYAIKRNETPKGALSVRFRIDAGSLMERDDEEGIAHVLEHMAFRGSAHVADGDTVKKLQSLGLAFGADTNAFTAPSQTVYSFDMPKSDEASVDTALLLMREIAGELTIDQKALDTERNVVLAEAHLRDVPAAHLQKADLAFLYGDRISEAMRPIGSENVVAHATSALVRGFYEAWYRPERATLIIVGDVDPAVVEAKIKAGFSDWQAKAPSRIPPAYVPSAQHADTLKLFAEAGAPSYVVFNWLAAYDGSPDNKANETRDMVRFIALAVLNQRLSILAHGANPPFISASASHDHVETVADATQLAVNYRDGEELEGVQAAERAWRDIVAHGVRQDEMNQVVAQLRAFFQGNAAAADTTQSAQIIDSLLSSVDEKSVFTAPAYDLSLFEEVVKGATVDRVNKAIKFVFGGDGPFVFFAGATPLAGGEAVLKAALVQADATPVANGRSEKLPPWPYTSFGKPGTVASQHTVDDLGVTHVRFANGVLLTVKPTTLKAGQILVGARFGNGRLGLPRDRVAPSWALSNAFSQGGLKRYGIDDLQKRMAGRRWGASLALADDSFLLTGSTRAEDLDAEMQVLAAYVTDPAWTPQAFDQVRTAYAESREQSDASPFGVLAREFSGLVHVGDPRWSSPSTKEIRSATLDDTKALIAQALASGPLDITIVGDTTVDAAIRSVAATFGALPPRPSPQVPVIGDERFPAPTPDPVVLTDRGAANQAIAMIVWPTTGFFPDMKLQRTLRVLGEIFSQRLLDQLRTREGITYSPGASTAASLSTKDYGYLYALAQIPPDKIANVFSAVSQVEGDLAGKPVSADELDRARGPRIGDIGRQQQTNEYWLSLLGGSQADPRLLDIVRSTIPDLQSVTADDVQKAARTFLKDDKAYRLVVKPAP
jgi:zinc protease